MLIKEEREFELIAPLKKSSFMKKQNKKTNKQPFILKVTK